MPTHRASGIRQRRRVHADFSGLAGIAVLSVCLLSACGTSGVSVSGIETNVSNGFAAAFSSADQTEWPPGEGDVLTGSPQTSCSKEGAGVYNCTVTWDSQDSLPGNTEPYSVTATSDCATATYVEDDPSAPAEGFVADINAYATGNQVPNPLHEFKQCSDGDFTVVSASSATASTTPVPAPSAPSATAPTPTPAPTPTAPPASGIASHPATAAEIADFTAAAVGALGTGADGIDTASYYLGDARVTSNGWAKASLLARDPADQGNEDLIFRLAGGRWKYVTGGSSFGSAVPSAVLHALYG